MMANVESLFSGGIFVLEAAEIAGHTFAGSSMCADSGVPPCHLRCVPGLATTLIAQVDCRHAMASRG